ncbi:MAG: acyl-CoA thioesterase, partial [Eubacteriales bacterium]
SLEVRVDSMVERLDGSRELINRAYVVFVALDENDRPSPVPPFVPETEEEKRMLQDAEIRKHIRMSLADEAKGGK